MLTYIIRRFTQSLLTVLLIMFAMWSVGAHLSLYGPTRSYNRTSAQLDAITKEADAIPLVQREGTGSRYNRLLAEAEDLKLEKRALEQQYSMDKPWPLSFLAWVYDPADSSYYDTRDHKEHPYGLDAWIGPLHITGSGLVTGDWGGPRVENPRFPSGIQGNALNTLLLLVLTLILSVALALPVGVLGAAKHDTKLDHTLTFFTITGLSTPPFVTGFLLIVFLGIIPYQLHYNNNWTWLPYLPTGGGHGMDKNGDFADYIYHMVLPLTTLVLIIAPGFSRYVRASMLDVLGKDYIRTARAKGARPYKIFFRHALRNAALPLITAVGLSTPFILTALGIIEYVFGYPGVGSYFTKAVLNAGNSPAALQAGVIAVGIISLLNMLADILYTVIDPRVSFSKA
jgi:peptide/nickel transport system permease protein